VKQTALALEPGPRVTERELITRVLDGDRIAARALYDAHVLRVHRLAFRLTGEPDLAREVTQDTFVRAFAQLARFRGEAALSTWLHRITLGVAANATRKVRRLHARETVLDDAHPIAADDATIDPILRARLHQAIDALSEIYRTVVVMHDIEGYTHTEIAETLGVPEGTCKSRLFTARAQLRAALGSLAEEMKT
jgi:RNA polymerase sigma-70 factor (ECF subfamily)